MKQTRADGSTVVTKHCTADEADDLLMNELRQAYEKIDVLQRVCNVRGGEIRRLLTQNSDKAGVLKEFPDVNLGDKILTLDAVTTTTYDDEGRLREVVRRRARSPHETDKVTYVSASELTAPVEK
jgi:hypothetical protein